VTIRRAIERRIIAANLIGGPLVGSYFISMRDVDPGDTLLEWWAAVVVTSLMLNVLGAVVTIALSRRFLGPVLQFLDEERAPTDAERSLLVRTPRTITLVVYAGWTLAAVAIGGYLLTGGDTKAAAASFVGNLLSGLIAGNLAYLVAERHLRAPYARAFAAQPPEERPSFGARRRLLLAWSLGSGIPLLGIAITPLVRDRSAEVSASVPMALLAVIGLAAGAVITMAEAGALATPMTRLRLAMGRVREGDLDVAVPVDSPGEVGLVQTGFNEMVDGLRQRQHLQDLFGRHVGEEVARRAVDQGVHLGGERREVSVLFVDLIGSSVMAREGTPEEVVATLNRFFTAVVEVVGTEGGWVNEFEGDGALCVFGAPAEHPDHAGATVRAAVALHDRLVDLGVDAGIGVGSGDVVAGNVGSETRYEYTVIGHPVNVASRLCDAAKHHPARVLSAVGGEGWACVETLELRGVGEVRVYAPTGSRAGPAPARSPRTAP
jgi:adenylate cyclase